MPTVGKLTRSSLAHTMPVHADPLSFTSALHELPIVGAVEATAYYNAAFRLHRPTETYPLGA